MKGWLFLSLAIFLEVAGTTSMKYSLGLTRAFPSLIMFGCYLAAFAFLSLALKWIDMSVAYAVWSGLGMVLVSFIGVSLFQESFSLTKGLGIALIIIGVICLTCPKPHSGIG